MALERNQRLAQDACRQPSIESGELTISMATPHFEEIYAVICRWAGKSRIEVREAEMPSNKVGEFNGPTVIVNPTFSFEERAYYLAHALGSTVLWSQDKEAVQTIFNELRAAKEAQENDQKDLDRAIDRYRSFEIKSSELAVWLLTHLGYEEVLDGYTNFMRADLESMTILHRQGEAPPWAEFFAQWKKKVARGERYPTPFRLRRIKSFSPVKFDLQEILQKQ
jgi:hypothetical protein